MELLIISDNRGGQKSAVKHMGSTQRNIKEHNAVVTQHASSQLTAVSRGQSGYTE
jgi:hypothetical protein